MKNKKTAAAAAVAVALVGTPACKKISSLQQVAGAVSGQASGENADAQLGAKLSRYIDCFNQLSKSVHSSEDRYFDWVDEKKGPTGKEQNVYGLYDIQSESCLQALDKAKTLPPSLPDVEAAAETYRAATSKLQPLVQAANKYYDQKDYQDDKYAKGKEMHGPLVAAFAAFDEADKALGQKVTTLNDALGERRLEALAKDPTRKLQYLVEKSVADAKKLLAAAKVRQLDALDEAKFQAALTAFATAETNLETFSNTNKEEADKASTLSSVISAEQDLLKASKALLRRKRDKKDFNKEFFSASNPQMVEGHPAQVIEMYNALIDRANDVQYNG